MPLLTELRGDLVTPFYNDVAPTALADTSAPAQFPYPNGITSFSPAVARDELPWSSGNKMILNPNGVAAPMDHGRMDSTRSG